MFFLFGVPGKLKAIKDHLTSYLSSTRMAKVDYLTANVAVASTALDNTVWTNALATYLASASRRKPVASIVNYCSPGSVQVASNLGAGVQEKQINAQVLLSGALTANTLTTSITHTGAGVVRFLMVNTVDTTSRTVRMKVTLDGVVVFDATSNAIITARSGLISVGSCGGSGATDILHLGNLEYDTSLLVEIASSLTETNKIATIVNRETRA